MQLASQRFHWSGWIFILLAAPGLLLFREMVTYFGWPRSFISYYPWFLFLLIPFYGRMVLYVSLLTAALTSTAALWVSARNNPFAAQAGRPTDMMEMFGVMVNANAIISTVATCIMMIGIAEVLFWFINKQQRLNNELRLAVAKAEDAAMAKSRFLAVMSHEIRTPISGIMGMTQLLRDDEVDLQKQHSLQLIMDSAEGLNHIVNSTLDFSRIEAHQLTLQPEVFALGDLLDSVVEAFQVSAKRKRLDVKLILADGMRTQVYGDRFRLRQILANLLSNAIKFTPKGGIEVEAWFHDQQEDSRCLLVQVRDTGIGIPTDMLGKLFDPFEQVNSSYTRSSEGTGLGLSIAREIARCMGGDISVQSTVNSGSCFTMTCWFHWPEPGSAVVASNSPPVHTLLPAESEAADAVSGMRVMVVEDNPVNMLYITRLLSKLGCSVLQAENGQEAVTAYVESGAELIFMDIQMPIMSGIEATVQIRQYEQSQQAVPVPVYALSACVTEQDQQRVLDAGLDGFLAKPVNIKQIQAILVRYQQQVA